MFACTQWILQPPIHSVAWGMGTACKFSVSLEEVCVYQHCRELKKLTSLRQLLIVQMNTKPTCTATANCKAAPEDRFRTLQGAASSHAATQAPSDLAGGGLPWGCLPIIHYIEIKTLIFLIFYNICITQCKLRSVEQEFSSGIFPNLCFNAIIAIKDIFVTDLFILTA